jgi:YHS domain-containing protein
MTDPIDMAMREPLSERPEWKLTWKGKTFYFIKREAAEAFARGIRMVSRKVPEIEPAEDPEPCPENAPSPAAGTKPGKA